MAKMTIKKEHLKMTSVLDWLLMLLIFGVLTLIINTFSYKNPIIESIPGMLVLIAITFVGMLLAKLIPLKVPAIIYISLIALVISLPVCGAVSEFVYTSTSKISTLALCTVILAYSGVAIGKSWAEFKKMGWRGIVVTLCVILGTFLGSALIAQFVLKMQGII
ncbi:MAG TPA: hypothetical protein DG577_04755 [Firmicutes bacterium]|jgi:hypothetical protein|nr:hypothetical protein [Bacillota bacterium]